jgi:N-carbamoylputrescine amidase
LTKCAIVEWPDGLDPAEENWDIVVEQVRNAQPHMLVTNEMPFGSWLASAEKFSARAADQSIAAHERGLAALSALGVPTIISSRPVWAGGSLVNEAFVLEDGTTRSIHRKQFFPNEPGFYEANWFKGDTSGFIIQDIAGLKVGVLLCTELMFNEHARNYGRAAADLIVVPRSTGRAHEKWITAGAMAAIVAGSYVLSSNRVGGSPGGLAFGGKGFAFAPDGTWLVDTSAETPLRIIELDTEVSRRQKSRYPCYVGR